MWTAVLGALGVLESKSRGIATGKGDSKNYQSDSIRMSDGTHGGGARRRRSRCAAEAESELHLGDAASTIGGTPLST